MSCSPSENAAFFWTNAKQHQKWDFFQIFNHCVLSDTHWGIIFCPIIQERLMKFWIQNTEIPKIFNLIFGAKIQIFLSLKFYQNWISWDKNWPFAPVCATALDSIKVHHNFLRLRATIKLNGRLHKCNKRPWLMLSMQSILIVIAFEISIFLSPSSVFCKKEIQGDLITYDEQGFF